MARKIIEFIDCWQVYNKSLLRKTFVQANSSSLSYLLIALNQIWGSNFKSLNVSRSHSKHFEVSVSQSKKSKCLGLAKKNASLAVSHLPFATPSFLLRILQPKTNPFLTSYITALNKKVSIKFYSDIELTHRNYGSDSRENQKSLVLQIYTGWSLP